MMEVRMSLSGKAWQELAIGCWIGGCAQRERERYGRACWGCTCENAMDKKC